MSTITFIFTSVLLHLVPATTDTPNMEGVVSSVQREISSSGEVPRTFCIEKVCGTCSGVEEDWICTFSGPGWVCDVWYKDGVGHHSCTTV